MTQDSLEWRISQLLRTRSQQKEKIPWVHFFRRFSANVPIAQK